MSPETPIPKSRTLISVPDGPESARKRICVFCGSSDGAHPRYLDTARQTGRLLATRGKEVVYGGGNGGLMGAVADAALAAGTQVHGVLPYGLQAMEVAHDSLTSLEIVDTLHERKARMMQLSGGFLVLPGGHGTLEELFEVLTWLQLAIHDSPVGVLNLDGYYDHIVAHLDHATQEGFIRPEHRQLVIVEANLETLLDRMDGYEPPTRSPWNPSRPRP